MSQINVDRLKSRDGNLGPNIVGLTTVTGNLDVIGVVTATSFVGDVRPNSLEVSGVSTFTGNIDANSGLIVSGVTTVSAGSTSAPSITPTGDSNTGFFFPSADTIAFAEGGNEVARFDSSGNFGLGIANPRARLSISGASGTNGINLYDNGGNYRTGIGGDQNNLRFYFPSNGSGGIQFGTLSVSDGSTFSESGRFDSSGRLLIGTSSARAADFVTGALQVEGTNQNTSSIQLTCNSSASPGTAPVLTFSRSRGSAVGDSNAVDIGDMLGGLIFTGADNTDIQSAGAAILAYVDLTPGSNDMPGRLVFSTTADGASSPTERMRITSAGYMGLGTQSPQNQFVVSDGGASGIEVSPGHTTGASLLQSFNRSTVVVEKLDIRGSEISFQNSSSSTAATIDSSGRLLVGTTSAFDSTRNAYESEARPNRVGYVATATNSVDNGFGLYNFSSSSYAPNLDLCISRSGVIGGHSIVANDSAFGHINFGGSDGALFRTGATILGAVDGAPADSSMPGRLVFFTTSSGSTAPTERMRITSGGTLRVGTTSAEPAGCSIFTRSNSSDFGIVDQPTTSVGYPMGFYNSSGTGVGYIETTASSTNYVTSSDYRLKENVVPLTGAADRINQLQVHRFNFIVDPDTTVDGFLAHEAQIVVPEAVSGTHNGVEVWKEGE